MRALEIGWPKTSTTCPASRPVLAGAGVFLTGWAAAAPAPPSPPPAPPPAAPHSLPARPPRARSASKGLLAGAAGSGRVDGAPFAQVVRSAGAALPLFGSPGPAIAPGAGPGFGLLDGPPAVGYRKI